MPRSWPPRLDAADSDVGQLQRGLGMVARRAYAGEVDQVADLVVACVAADPRWDQIDTRGDYYARLALHAGTSPSIFESMVFVEESEQHEGDPGASLALRVVTRMASLGDREALAVARRYIGVGRYWDDVLLELADGPDQQLHPEWEARVGDLGSTLMSRWANEDEMIEEIDWLFDADPDIAPWSALASGQPTLRRVLKSRIRERRESQASGPWEELPRLSTLQLLSHDDRKHGRYAALALASRNFTVAEMARLEAVAKDPSAPMHPAAVATLARLGRADVLDATLAFPSTRQPDRSLLFRAFSDLPLDATRPHVIDWLNGHDDYRRRAAAAALSQHATTADLTLARERLATETARGLEGEQYVICDLATALAKHPAHGPFPEIAAAYESMPYSYGRQYIVNAMAATDPAFPAGVGIDCLWDAETPTRCTAAKHVDRNEPTAAARLRELAADEDENPDVRDAARAPAGPPRATGFEIP